jgi:hypothetical protein
MKIGSVVEDKKGNLYRVNHKSWYTVLNKIENNRISGLFTCTLFPFLYKPRNNLKYDLYRGLTPCQ